MRMDIDRWPNTSRPYKEPHSMIEVRKRKLCEWCNKAEAWVLHHIDCNPSNNNIENLLHLCSSCHKKCHSHFPNWRYLHNKEIRFIIKEAMKILDDSDTATHQYSDPIGDQYTKTTDEENKAMVRDVLDHPLPY